MDGFRFFYLVVMKEFFKLIRWYNLVIVILTMVLVRYAVIQPLLMKTAIVLNNDTIHPVPLALRMPLPDFVLLVLATVLITAGGYVINDYFDIRTDLINRGKVIVGTKVPRRMAMTWHLLLNFAGVIIGFYISWKTGLTLLGLIFLLVAGLLYFYSASYKSQFLVGNLIVAFLTAMVPMLVILYDWPAIYSFYRLNSTIIPQISFLFYWVGGFALFAFLATLIREIIKDIEDFEGDISYGRNTVPVVLGIKSAKIISVILIAVTIVLLYLAWIFFINDRITVIYFTVAIVLPLLFVIYRLYTGTEKKHIHFASYVMKGVMLTGILYMVLVKIILTWNLF